MIVRSQLDLKKKIFNTHQSVFHCILEEAVKKTEEYKVRAKAKQVAPSDP
jgi:hypothetical protein